MADPETDDLSQPEPPKSLRSAVDSEGVLSDKGRVSREWLESKAAEPGSIGRRARLALKLKGQR